MSAKLVGAWDAVEKQVLYFERQCELFASSLSSLSSSKMELITLPACKRLGAWTAEVRYHSHLYNCKNIIDQMSNTLALVKKDMDVFLVCMAKDAVLYAGCQTISNEIMSLCENQADSCEKAFEFISNEPLPTEEMVKSLLALVVHRPQVWDIKTRLFPDIKILVANKM